MNYVRLHVNVDHVATIRQARGVSYPDPVWAATVCELAGADGITVHLREDRRHIIDRDVRLLRETVRTVLNLEMAAGEEMTAIACEIGPDICTLVPEKREEKTTEGGLAVQGADLEKTIKKLTSAGIRVSLFVDPEIPVIRASSDMGANMIELHTGDYCNAKGGDRAKELNRLATAAEEAMSCELGVAAGHGLDYPNVREVAAIPGIEELNIGHAIIARSVFSGLDRAVRDMIDTIRIGVFGV